MNNIANLIEQCEDLKRERDNLRSSNAILEKRANMYENEAHAYRKILIFIGEHL